MRNPRFGRWSKVTAAAGAMLLSMSAAYATGAQGSLDVVGVTKVSGTSISQVKLVRNSNAASTTSQTYLAVPGATTTLTVPAGSKAVIVARFSAISVCEELSDARGYGCNVRVMVNGAEAAPAGTSVFDSSGKGNSREAHAIERSRGPVGPGTYVVSVQFSVPAATVTLTLSKWTLEVDRIKA